MKNLLQLPINNKKAKASKNKKQFKEKGIKGQSNDWQGHRTAFIIFLSNRNHCVQKILKPHGGEWSQALESPSNSGISCTFLEFAFPLTANTRYPLEKKKELQRAYPHIYALGDEQRLNWNPQTQHLVRHQNISLFLGCVTVQLVAGWKTMSHHHTHR